MEHFSLSDQIWTDWWDPKAPPPPVYIRVVITGLWAFSSDRSVCWAWTQGGSWLSVTFVLLHVVFRNSEVVREGWGVSKHMFYPLTPNPRLPRSAAAVSQKSVWFHSSKFCCFQMGVGGRLLWNMENENLFFSYNHFCPWSPNFGPEEQNRTLHFSQE